MTVVCRAQAERERRRAGEGIIVRGAGKESVPCTYGAAGCQHPAAASQSSPALHTVVGVQHSPFYVTRQTSELLLSFETPYIEDISF